MENAGAFPLTAAIARGPWASRSAQLKASCARPEEPEDFRREIGHTPAATGRRPDFPPSPTSDEFAGEQSMVKDRPDERETLKRALMKLPAIEREMLLLSRIEGLSCREIAARTGISEAAAERHLGNALYELDRRLERQRRTWWKWW